MNTQDSIKNRRRCNLIFKELDCRLFGCGGVISLDRTPSKDDWGKIVPLMRELSRCDQYHDSSTMRLALGVYPISDYKRVPSFDTEMKTISTRLESKSVSKLTVSELDKGVRATSNNRYLKPWTLLL